MANYSVKQVKASFLDKPLNAGRGDGTFVKIAKVNKGTFKVKAGIDSTFTYYTVGDNAHLVTLVLMKSSLTNDLLSAIFNGDVLSDNGSGIGPLLIEDKIGSSLLSDPEARISGLPDEEHAQEPGTLEWEILAPNPVRFVGGNP